jgi:hypothetical protein
VGVDLDTFDIGAIDEGDYCVKFHLCKQGYVLQVGICGCLWSYSDSSEGIIFDSTSPYDKPREVTYSYGRGF